jgi:hypothetical protein
LPKEARYGRWPFSLRDRGALKQAGGIVGICPRRRGEGKDDKADTDEH